MAMPDEDIVNFDMPDIGGDPEPKLKDSDRKRLDSIVQKMIANKESDEAISMVVGDFKSKYAVKPLVQRKEIQKPIVEKGREAVSVFGEQAKPQEIVKFDTPRLPTKEEELQLGERPKYPSLEMPQRTRENIQKNKLIGNAKVSQENILKELTENDDVVEKRIRQRRFENEAMGRSIPASDMPRTASSLSAEMLTIAETKPQDVPVTSEDMTQEKTDIEQDEQLARNFLQEIGNEKPDKRRVIERSVYLVDAARSIQQDPNAAKRMQKINSNSDRIEKGELSYDVRFGRLIKPQGVVGSLLTGWEQKSKLFDDFHFLTSASDEQIISELEKRRLDFDPDEAVAIPKHKTAELSLAVGSMPTKSLIAGAVASAVPGGQQAAPFIAGAVGAADFYRMGYAGALQNVYQQLRSEGMSEAEALMIAKSQAKNEGYINAAVGGGMSFMGLRFGGRIPGFSPNYIKAAGVFLKGAAKEGAFQSVIGAGGEVAKNVLAQKAGINRATDDNVLAVMESNFLLTVGMAAAAKAGRGVSTRNYRSLLNGLSKVNKELLDANINAELQSGRITEEQAETIRNELAEYEKINSVIPPDVTEEARLDIQKNISKRDGLKEKLETQHEAFHPAIKEQIKAIDEEINSLAQQKEPKIKSDPATKEAQRLVQDALMEGEVSGPAKAFLDEAVKDPQEFSHVMQEIAAQARDKFSANQTRQAFGDRVVDKALEMFPLQEKKSSISVIRPEDVKKPNVVEAKAAEVVPEAPVADAGIPPAEEGAALPPEATPQQPEMIGITHAQMDSVAREFGFDEYRQDPETIAQWDAQARERFAKDPDAANKLINKLRRGEGVDKVETRMMIMHMADLKARYNNNPTPELRNEIQRTIDLYNISGREKGKELVARKGMTPVEETLIDYHLRDVEFNRGAPLTEDQLAQSTKEFRDIDAAKKAYEEKVATLEAENAKLKAEKKVKDESAKAKKSEKKDYKTERSQILDDIKRKWNESQKQASATFVPYAEQLVKIAPDIAKLMRNIVEEGVTKLPDVVKAIHDQIRGVIPEVTEKDVHDIIAGEYSAKRSRNDIMEKLYDLRTEAKLINKLEALEAGVQPKSPKQRRTRNQQIEELRKQIKELQGDARTDAQKLAAIKTRTKSEIAKLEDQLKRGDFSKDEKTPVELDDEAIELKDRLIELKKEREVRLAEQEYANRPAGQKALDIVLAPFREVRTLKSSFDLSAPLRQGVVPTAAEFLTNPKSAANRFGNMLKSAGSEKFFDRWMHDLKESGAWRLMEESGLGIADPNNISKAEEVFQSNYAKKYIPGVKGSERAYAYFLNSQRADLFLKGADILADRGMTFKNSPDEYKHWADTVNALTGKGKLIGPFANAAEVLSVGLFSPRLMASRLAFFNPAFYAKIPKPLRMMVVKDLIKFIGLGTAVVSAFALAHPDAEVETDPRTADFAKIKIGDTRYDPWGGFQQYVRLFAQLGTMTKKTGSGQVKSLWEKGQGGQRELGNVVSTFLRSKASPVLGSIINVATGKTPVGEETDLGTEAKKFLMPLLWEDTIEALLSGDMEGVAHELTKVPPAIFGVGVQEYEQNATKKSSGNQRREKRAKRPKRETRQ